MLVKDYLIEPYSTISEPTHLMSQPNDHNATDRCEDLDSISEHDRNWLRDWNGELPPLVNSLIHSQIESQSKRHPLNEAVCAWDGTLTYEELSQRANALASCLVEAGLQVGDYVPLLFEKSKWYIVSILAVSSTDVCLWSGTDQRIGLGPQSRSCIRPVRTDDA